jgi:hypothetical protein
MTARGVQVAAVATTDASDAVPAGDRLPDADLGVSQ